MSRPPLEVADLPTPEEAFAVRRIGPRELFGYAVGPSLIASARPRPWHYVILVLNFLFFGFFFVNFVADFLGDPLVTF